jgi:hypothetical protein
MPSAKEQFLDAYEREHGITMKVLRSFPEKHLDLRPHAKCKTARELAWIFALERGFATKAFHNEFANPTAFGTPPAPPESWSDLLGGIEKVHREFGELVRSTPEPK